MTKERYLMMKEQLGEEPVEEEIPAGFEDFPYEVQEAINIFSILPDVWEGFSGTYMGKIILYFLILWMKYIKYLIKQKQCNIF
jgi:hypothetical protein